MKPPFAKWQSSIPFSTHQFTYQCVFLPFSLSFSKKKEKFTHPGWRNKKMKLNRWKYSAWDFETSIKYLLKYKKTKNTVSLSSKDVWEKAKVNHFSKQLLIKKYHLSDLNSVYLSSIVHTIFLTGNIAVMRNMKKEKKNGPVKKTNSRANELKGLSYSSTD